MALPILETPTYELILPSTGKKIKYRPFLVKEYKVLLTLLESDPKEISRVVIDLVDGCTFKKLNLDKLAHFDVEYLFLNIRARSISETAEIILNCECGQAIDCTIDLTKAIIEKDKNIQPKIMLTEDVGVVMRYPKFDEILEIYDNTKSENVVSLIGNCIESIFTKDEFYDKDSYSSEELEEFINSFSKKQFDKLEKFFESIPRVVQEIEADCPSCGKKNLSRLEGLQNFFV